MSRLAALSAQAYRGPTLWLGAVSLGAYLTIALRSASEGVAALCGRISELGVSGVAELGPLSPGAGALAADWILMTVAMMIPLTGSKAAYVSRSVSRSQRAPAVLAFLLGYLSCWVLSGLLLVPAALLLALVGYPFSLLTALAVAFVWSMSPFAQKARNACHRQGRVDAFGLNAQADGCWLGLQTGLSCLMACWPFMLVPLLVETGHVAVMIFTGLVLFADRVAPAAPVAWRLPPFLETLVGIRLLRT